MSKRIALLAAALIVMGSGSVLFALPPMGPPRALVGQDQWAVGVGFSHSRMDLEGSGTAREDPDGGGWLPPSYAEHRIEDLTSNMVLARVSYGAFDSVDVFACLGLSDAQDDMTEELATGADGNRYRELDCGHGFAYGFGARATFWQEDDIAWGGLVQALWQNPSDGDIDLVPKDGDPARMSGDAELDLLEIQVAVGPTVQANGFSVYGGPFLHFVSGDLDVSVAGTDSFLAVNRVELSQDVDQESELGFFVGAQGDANQDITWYAEFQITGDAWGIGVGGVRKF